MKQIRNMEVTGIIKNLVEMKILELNKKLFINEVI